MSWWQGDDTHSDTDDQARRLAAMRSLARRANDASDTSALADTQPRLARVANQANQADTRAPHQGHFSPQAQRPRSRLPLQTALIAVFIVALLAGAGAWYLRSNGRIGAGTASEPPMPAVRTINLAAYNYSCPMSPAWSPDGSKIAFAVTAGDCTNQQTGGHLLAIFDTHTGKLVNSFPLSRLLASQNIPTTEYLSSFVWTPDGASLVAAVGYDPNQILPPDAKRGLLSITLATKAMRLITDATTTKQPAPGTMLIWDVKAGKLAHTITDVPPATAYAWGADGSLSPAAGATGKDAISVWQDGSIEPFYAEGWQGPGDPPVQQTLAQRFVYLSYLPHWSPDGRFLALPAVLGVRLPGGVNAYPIAGDCQAICQGAPTSLPNAGFSAILKAEQAGWKAEPQQPALVNSEDIAWRADGQELATMLPGQDFNTDAPTATVTIFNAHTGAIVKKLTISRVMTNFSYSGLGQVVWSPRGASLAALNYADATITLWRAE